MEAEHDQCPKISQNNCRRMFGPPDHIWTGKYNDAPGPLKRFGVISLLSILLVVTWFSSDQLPTGKNNIHQFDLYFTVSFTSPIIIYLQLRHRLLLDAVHYATGDIADTLV